MEVQQAPRVAILDPDRLAREALARALATEGLNVGALAATPDELLAAVEAAPPQVAILETAPESEPRVVRALRERQQPVPAVILGAAGDAAAAERCYREGASGFVHRDVGGLEALLHAIHACARGELHFPWGDAPPPLPPPSPSPVGWKLHRLTPREREVLAHVAAGHDNLKIAALLNISERTVKSHVISVYRKLDAENRVQLALLAGQLGVAPAAS